VILRYDGIAWAQVASPTCEHLRGMTMISILTDGLWAQAASCFTTRAGSGILNPVQCEQIFMLCHALFHGRLGGGRAVYCSIMMGSDGR